MDERGTTGDAERRPPESASGVAGRMADRPGEADAALIREWFTAGSRKRWRTACWHRAPNDVIAAFDRLTARLEEAEEALEAVKVVRGKLIRESDRRLGEATRAERRLSDYEQAREVAHEDANYVLRWLEQTKAPANIIGLQTRVRAALSGSAGPP